MGPHEIVNTIEPLRGDVIPIRTVQETRPIEEFGDAYVAEVNVKAASKVVKFLDSSFHREPMPHLRRFAKRENLPESLRSAIDAARTTPPGRVPTIYVVVAPPLPDVDELAKLLAPFAPETYMAKSSPTADKASPDPEPSKVIIVKTKIPLVPPFNIHQAEKWTKTLWPVTFNPATPRSTVAPPLQVLSRAREDIRPRAGYFLSLAQKVAQEALESGRGRGVGAVIVDPAIEADLEDAAAEDGSSSTDRWAEAIMAVGGDARYSRSEAGAPSQLDLHPGIAPNPAGETYNADIEGGPELHALMRAVELVSRKRREDPGHVNEFSSVPIPIAATADTQLSNRMTPLETYFLSRASGARSSTSGSTPLPVVASPPSSPKKRKHEEKNPESGSVSLDTPSVHLSLSSNQVTPSPNLPLPGPPPSTVAAAGISESIAVSTSNISSTTPTKLPDLPTPENTNDHSVESTTSRILPRSQGGYLCTDLDVYMSHEPCLCCSMGLLLSRFRAVIFPRSGRMDSGGLVSEPVVSASPTGHKLHWDECPETKTDLGQSPGESRQYYGLHWRKELNWRALGFEFVEDDASEESRTGDGVVFHA